MSTEVSVKKTEQTSAGLCSALFDEFDMLRNGDSNPQRAAAVAKLAVQIINTKRLEIEAAAFYRDGLRLAPLALTAKGVAIGENHAK